MTDDYDPIELERAVAEALGEITSSSPRALFSFGDTKMLEKLAEILPQYIPHHADVPVVLEELRSALYEGTREDSASDQLRQLHTALAHCRKCPLMRPEPHQPHWNLSDPDVVFVADAPITGSPSDQHLFTALKQVGFRSARIAATSVTRCLPKERRNPNTAEISTCSTRFLFTELQLLRPKLIVALGGSAASVLLGTPIKVTEEHGRTMWVGPWPILVTYSAGYATRTERAGADFRNDLQQAYTAVYGAS